jgi:xeroderma pigmentosum group C-complementing protein
VQQELGEEIDASAAANGASGSGGPPEVKLYGYWQTQPWAPPVAQGGIVPKNDRGNVEVPPLVKALPGGTVHLALPLVWQSCKKLGVDYAPALVGFEVQGGRMVPKIEGVVICEVRGEADREGWWMVCRDSGRGGGAGVGWGGGRRGR